MPAVKTVVNKLNQIDNTFRNFQMELLAGEEKYVTTTHEHGCTFELDFSKVYWNPRLGEWVVFERQRLLFNDFGKISCHRVEESSTIG